MKIKETPKRTAAKKAGVGAKAVETDPFAEVAADVPAAKPKFTKAAAKTIPAKKAGPNAAASIADEPVIAGAEASPKPKKPAAKTAGAKSKPLKKNLKATPGATAKIAAAEPQAELSPEFMVLAEPKLPELKREIRARLQMQSPVSLYFYWSIKENPHQLLRAAFGDETAGYKLVAKLTDLIRETEEIHAVEAEGNWWFHVEPGGEYQAEIGFYSPKRPYFRILYSNTVATPRRSPSRRAATESDWKVTANKFAEVLDVAGFTEDAFEVALAGDDHLAADNATHAAFSSVFDAGRFDLKTVAAEDLRHALIALAAGSNIGDLHARVGPAFFAILQANEKNVTAKRASAALEEYMDIGNAEFKIEQAGSNVFGASRLNFPRTLKKRLLPSRYNPVSSHGNR